MNSFLCWLARVLFRIFGWKTEGTVPEPRHFVLIAAPHTSNWDGLIMVVAAYHFRLPISWFVKDNLMFWPMGPFLRAFGAIPIDRRARHNTVEQMSQWIRKSAPVVVAVAPEGSRSKRPHWKSGFYHIARMADVPIVLGYIDFGRKVAGLGPSFKPTGDIEADFRVFAEFYKDVEGCNPDQVSPVLPPPSSAEPPPSKEK